MTSLDNSLTFLNEQKGSLQKEIDEHLEQAKLKEEKELLLSVPGVGEKLSAPHDIRSNCSTQA